MAERGCALEWVKGSEVREEERGAGGRRVQELALLVGHCTDYQMPQLFKVSTRSEIVTFSHFVKFG